ncbi:MAG: hypothetical protein ACJA2S_001967 [Cyclobacteriaceae bacterium]|jgi:hypothetical protein
MTTFTSSLPDDLLMRLNTAAGKLNLPKNKLIEKALNLYLDHLNRAEYVASYKGAGQDIEVMQIAEESMVEYMIQVDEAG